MIVNLFTDGEVSTCGSCLFISVGCARAQSLGPVYTKLEDKLLRFQMEEARALIPQLPNPAHQAFYQISYLIVFVYGDSISRHLQRVGR